VRPPKARERFLARGVRLVYEDPDLLVVDKATGIVTADPAAAAGAPKSMRPSARDGDTVFDVVKKHVRESVGKKRRRREDGPALGRVWIIHRLDKEASGLLVFAKSERAFAALKEEFRAKTAHREYVAVCEGALGEEGHTGTRRSMIEEDRGPTRRKREARGGERGGERGDGGEGGEGSDGDGGDGGGGDDGRRLAITHYKVVSAGNGRTLVKVRLETGRKNQIRIHMQELGHPLIGDRRFGASSDPIKRLALHAAELGFEHPGTRSAMRFNSPAPVSFAKAVGLEPESDQPDDETRGEAGSGGLGGSGASGVLKDADTSWNSVAEWYDALLEGSDKGNDHFENTILPGVMRLLEPKAGEKILDAACGQGMLSRRLAAAGASVVGVDAAPKLVLAARERAPKDAGLAYHVADARELPALCAAHKLGVFDAITCVMALTNIDPLADALGSMAGVLRTGGRLVFAITHPAFRVPGESDWGWDQQRQRQFRRVDVYMTSFARNIQMHPGKAAMKKRGGELATPTFHRPIGAYVEACRGAGLGVVGMQEWISTRAASSGPRAPEENRGRREFPLFMGVVAVKLG